MFGRSKDKGSRSRKSLNQAKENDSYQVMRQARKERRGRGGIMTRLRRHRSSDEESNFVERTPKRSTSSASLNSRGSIQGANSYDTGSSGKGSTTGAERQRLRQQQAQTTVTTRALHDENRIGDVDAIKLRPEGKQRPMDKKPRQPLMRDETVKTSNSHKNEHADDDMLAPPPLMRESTMKMSNHRKAHADDDVSTLGADDDNNDLDKTETNEKSDNNETMTIKGSDFLVNELMSMLNDKYDHQLPPTQIIHPVNNEQEADEDDEDDEKASVTQIPSTATVSSEMTTSPVARRKQQERGVRVGPNASSPTKTASANAKRQEKASDYLVGELMSMLQTKYRNNPPPPEDGVTEGVGSGSDKSDNNKVRQTTEASAANVAADESNKQQSEQPKENQPKQETQKESDKMVGDLMNMLTSKFKLPMPSLQSSSKAVPSPLANVVHNNSNNSNSSNNNNNNNKIGDKQGKEDVATDESSEQQSEQPKENQPQQETQKESDKMVGDLMNMLTAKFKLPMPSLQSSSNAVPSPSAKVVQNNDDSNNNNNDDDNNKIGDKHDKEDDEAQAESFARVYNRATKSTTSPDVLEFVGSDNIGSESDDEDDEEEDDDDEDEEDDDDDDHQDEEDDDDDDRVDTLHPIAEQVSVPFSRAMLHGTTRLSREEEEEENEEDEDVVDAVIAGSGNKMTMHDDDDDDEEEDDDDVGVGNDRDIGLDLDDLHGPSNKAKTPSFPYANKTIAVRDNQNKKSMAMQSHSTDRSTQIDNRQEKNEESLGNQTEVQSSQAPSHETTNEQHADSKNDRSIQIDGHQQAKIDKDLIVAPEKANEQHADSKKSVRSIEIDDHQQVKMDKDSIVAPEQTAQQAVSKHIDISREIEDVPPDANDTRAANEVKEKNEGTVVVPKKNEGVPKTAKDAVFDVSAPSPLSDVGNNTPLRRGTTRTSASGNKHVSSRSVLLDSPPAMDMSTLTSETPSPARSSNRSFDFGSTSRELVLDMSTPAKKKTTTNNGVPTQSTLDTPGWRLLSVTMLISLIVLIISSVDPNSSGEIPVPSHSDVGANWTTYPANTGKGLGSASEFNERNVNLQSELDSLRKQLQETTIELAAATNKENSLQQQLQEATATMETARIHFQEQIDAASKVKETLYAELNDARTLHATLAKQSAEQLNALHLENEQNLNERLTMMKEEHQAAMDRVLKEVEAKHAELMEATKARNVLDAELGDARLRLSSLENQSAKEIDAMKGENLNKEMKAMKEAHRLAMEMVLHEVEAKRAELDQATKSKDALESELRDARERLVSLENESTEQWYATQAEHERKFQERLNAMKREHQAAMDEVLNEVDTKRAELLEATNAKDVLEAKLREASIRHASLLKKAKNLEKALKDESEQHLNEKLKELHEEHKLEMEGIFKEVEAKRSEVLADINNLMFYVEHLKNTTAEIDDDDGLMTQVLEELQVQIEQVRREVETKKGSLSDVKQTDKRYKEQLRNALQDRAKLESELLMARKRERKLRKEMEKKIKAIEKERERFFEETKRKVQKQLKKIRSNLKEKHSELSSRLFHLLNGGTARKDSLRTVGLRLKDLDEWLWE